MAFMHALAATLLLLAARAQAELLVVVRADSPIAALSQRQVMDLYMGRSRRVAEEVNVHPLDLPSGEALRQRFYTALTGRGEAQVDAYWAQLVFAGRVTPLTRLESGEAMLERLREDPLAIGYLEGAEPPPELRAVLRLETP